MKKYNSGNMYQECFGFEPDVEYDALVVAPGWKPTKIIRDPAYTVTALSQHSYFSGYLVEKDGLKVAWAQTASGACNVLDHIIICAEMKFRHLIFAGAVGGLTDGFDIGDFCTPEVCISGVYSNHYLDEKLPEFKPFEKIYPDKEYMREIIDLASRSGYELRTAHVFNTDSISMEYSHLDEIKGTGAELIEMETGMFYTLARLFEKPAIALLAVSDNSATGIPLLGRGEDLAQRYIYTRSVVVPDMIFKIAGQAQYTWIKGAMPDGLAVRQVYGIVFSGDGQVLIRVEDGKNKLSGGKPEENESWFQKHIVAPLKSAVSTILSFFRKLFKKKK